MLYLKKLKHLKQLSWETLPTALFEHILGYLPQDKEIQHQILHLRQVCSLWKDSIELHMGLNFRILLGSHKDSTLCPKESFQLVCNLLRRLRRIHSLTVENMLHSNFLDEIQQLVLCISSPSTVHLGFDLMTNDFLSDQYKQTMQLLEEKFNHFHSTHLRIRGSCMSQKRAILFSNMDEVELEDCEALVDIAYLSTINHSVCSSFSLKKLSLKGCCRFEDAQLELLFERCHLLEYLFLEAAALEFPAITSEKLQELHLPACTDLIDESIVLTLNNCPRLERVSIHGVNDLEGLKGHLPNLQYAQLYVVNGDAMRSLCDSCPNLQHLELSSIQEYPRSDCSSRNMTPPLCPKLTKLQIFDTSGEIVLPICPSLEMVELRHCDGLEYWGLSAAKREIKSLNVDKSLFSIGIQYSNSTRNIFQYST